MSIRFSIQSTLPKAKTEGGVVIRYTGTAEPFNRHSERSVRKIGVDGAGNPKLLFTTGLDEKEVELYMWFTDEEKKVLSDTIKELKEGISRSFGGDQVIDPTNKYFWKDNRDINILTVKNTSNEIYYDTAIPAHALLYLSICAGAFIDLVAPTREWALRNQIPHYLSLEVEEVFGDDDEEIKKSEAHAALGDLRKNHGKEALYILAWCLQHDTTGFGAYSYSTTEKELVSLHVRYIDGKLVAKKRRNMPASFIEYYEKWLGPQTRKLLYTEAYLKAGEYYNFVLQKEKKYTTYEGTILGNTITDAVTALMKPKFHQDFEKLRDQVEAKWKE